VTRILDNAPPLSQLMSQLMSLISETGMQPTQTWEAKLY